ncbi:MAG: C40 family peptidase [Flavobacterium sp.]|uniref:C40 family peptidase n=1 Tax=Flavobacterium sp. TaxID=239 RepID=UPI003267544A
MLRFLSIIIIISLLSCKSKPIITDNDVNRLNFNSNERVVYDYKKTLSNEEITYFSKKLNVDKKAITNEKLYIFIKSWEETTYLLGGVNKNGVDCSALMQELYKYVYDTKLARTSTEMYGDKRFKMIKEGQPLEEGDLVFFKIKDDQVVSHVGIYLKNDKFFGASSTEGCSIGSLKKHYWQKSYVGAVRLKK